MSRKAWLWLGLVGALPAAGLCLWMPRLGALAVILLALAAMVLAAYRLL